MKLPSISDPGEETLRLVADLLARLESLPTDERAAITALTESIISSQQPDDPSALQGDTAAGTAAAPPKARPFPRFRTHADILADMRQWIATATIQAERDVLAKQLEDARRERDAWREAFNQTLAKLLALSEPKRRPWPLSWLRR